MSKFVKLKMSPNKFHTIRSSTRHIIIKLPKIKDKENLESSKKMKPVTYKGPHIRLSVVSQQKPDRPEGRMIFLFKVLKEKLPTKNMLSGKVDLQELRRDKEFARQTRAEGVYCH